MTKRWIQDIMSQNFSIGTFINPSRLIMVTYLMQKPVIYKVSKKEILDYMYRVYIDNLDIAVRNPSVTIRNIKNYGISDIDNTLNEALYDWCSDAKNNVISYDNSYVYFNIEITDALINNSMQVIKMLYKKYFKIDILFPNEIKDDDVNDDNDINKFGIGKFKDRVLEDMQYCPLCEQTGYNNLYAVHILPNMFNDNLEKRKDKYNGLLMCSEHAKSYINQEFYFNENGFVEFTKSKIVNKRMHLSFSINVRKRKEYIRMYKQLLENEGSNKETDE